MAGLANDTSFPFGGGRKERVKNQDDRLVYQERKKEKQGINLARERHEFLSRAPFLVRGASPEGRRLKKKK